MSDTFNERHLLYWVLKAVQAQPLTGVSPASLLQPHTWHNIGAPDWVLPAIREKHADMPDLAPLTQIW